MVSLMMETMDVVAVAVAIAVDVVPASVAVVVAVAVFAVAVAVAVAVVAHFLMRRPIKQKERKTMQWFQPNIAATATAVHS